MDVDGNGELSFQVCGVVKRRGSGQRHARTLVCAGLVVACSFVRASFQLMFMRVQEVSEFRISQDSLPIPYSPCDIINPLP
eukprot:359734-Chlamydomonas_euryale.AAC.6